jgi:hypothetical protein
MKKYAPILILTTIIAISAPFMRTVQGQPQVQRGRSQSAAAVVFTGTEMPYVNGLPTGYYVYVQQCSPNCPRSTSTDLAATIEFYLARGFTIQSSDGFAFRMIRLPSEDRIVKD